MRFSESEKLDEMGEKLLVDIGQNVIFHQLQGIESALAGMVGAV
jgi:hypothetical protein